MKDYLTVTDESSAEYVEKRSRFIAYLFPTKTVEEGLVKVAELKKRHKEATHVVYAIVSAPEENGLKSSDDGEPKGTGGAPVAEVLAKKKLFGVTLAVVRYFGGIKLGANGLTSAYKTAAVAVTDSADIKLAVWSFVSEVSLNYDEAGNFERTVSSYAEIIDRNFGEGVTFTVQTADPERLSADVRKITSGRTSPRIVNTEYKFYKGAAI